MIAIIHSLELKWPFYVSTYLRVSGNIGTVSTQLFSLDCLITDYELDIHVIYLKALANIMIYVGFLGGAAWIFALKNILAKKKKETSKFIILAIVISILMQPNNIKDTSDIFNCQTIDKTSYLIQEMKVECYTQDHEKWVFCY